MTDTRFHAPERLDEVISLLADDEESRPLAGGQTLVAMLNADLLSPSQIVSLHRIKALHGIERRADGTLRVGAMTTHAELARSDELRGTHRLLGEAAGRIGHEAIRNRGTIGGAVAHADPSADYPPALGALDAVIEAVGPKGKREIPAAKFFQGFLTTALGGGEIVVAIILPASPTETRTHYEKFARVEGDFATVSVAVALWSGGVRIALGGVGPVPVRSPEAEATLLAGRLSDAAIDDAGAILVAASDPINDVRGSANYRRLLIPRLVKRAIRRAQAKDPE